MSFYQSPDCLSKEQMIEVAQLYREGKIIELHDRYGVDTLVHIRECEYCKPRVEFLRDHPEAK